MNPEISMQVEEVVLVEQQPIVESEPTPEENFDLDLNDKIQPEVIDRSERAREAIFNGSNPESWKEDFGERSFGRLEGSEWLQEDGVSMTKEIEKAVADGKLDAKYLEMHYKDIRSFQENPDYISKYEFTDEQGNLHKSATWLENGKFKTVGMVFKSKEILQTSPEGEPSIDEDNEIGNIEPEGEEGDAPVEIKPEPRVISMTDYLNERFGTAVDVSLDQENVTQPEVIFDDGIKIPEVVSDIAFQDSLYATKAPTFEISGVDVDRVVESVLLEDAFEESMVDVVEPVAEAKPAVEARPSRVIDEVVPIESEASEWAKREEGATKGKEEMESTEWEEKGETGEMGLKEEAESAGQEKGVVGLMEREGRGEVGLVEGEEGVIGGEEEMGLANEVPISQQLEPTQKIEFTEVPRVVDAQPEVVHGEKAIKVEPVVSNVEVQAPRVVEISEVKSQVDVVVSKPVVEIQREEKTMVQKQENKPVQKIEAVSAPQERAEIKREERQEVAEVSDAQSEVVEVRAEVINEAKEASVVVEKAKEDIRAVEVADDIQEVVEVSEVSSRAVETNIEKPIVEAKEAKPEIVETRKVEAPTNNVKEVKEIKPVEHIHASKESEAKEEIVSKEIESDTPEVTTSRYENIILFPQPEVIRAQEGNKEAMNEKEDPESGVELLRRMWGLPSISKTVSREAVSARGNSAQGENDDATHYVAARDTKNGIALRRPRATLNIAA